MIKNTFEQTPDYVLSAYKDNAAVMEGSVAGRFIPIRKRALPLSSRACPYLNESGNAQSQRQFLRGLVQLTGSGGEIRDEGRQAVGQNLKPV